jgi:ADP-heptose:LPS heptosyltransferase
MKAFIGDAVMALPLLEELRRELDTVVVAPHHIGDVLGPEWEQSFIPIMGRGFLPRVRALKQAEADLAIVLNRSFRSALSTFAAGIKTRVGHDAEGRGLLLTHRVPLNWHQHESESYLDLARAVNLNVQSIHPHLLLTAEERKKGRQIIANADVALQPGARHEYKQLTLTTLKELVTLLQAEGYSPVLVGGKDELEVAGRLQSVVPEIPSLVGQCSLRETMSVLAAAKIAIGSDTGVMHLAAAVGTPTVTVFEPSQPPTRWGHLYEPHQIVQAGEAGITAVTAESMMAAFRGVTKLISASKL